MINRQHVLKSVLWIVVALSLVSGTAFGLGIFAQRSCWPRLCTHKWNLPVDSLIETVHARIASEEVALPFDHEYGALETHDSSYVVASGDGSIFRVSPTGRTSRLPFDIPVDARQFHLDAGEEGIQSKAFSAKDILLLPRPNTDVEILATYHVWFPKEQCYTVRMSSAVADASLTELRQDWRTLYDAKPCAPLKDSGIRFAGSGAGGRMTKISDNEVLLTIGDHEFDALNGTHRPQDPATSFGKTILVDITTGAARVFSVGHRNPQGLVRARDGRIFSTEHGPKGGDELNLLQEGQNYGWPLATYGAQYNEYAWPLAPLPHQEETFVRPMHSWVPSIGVSQVIEVEGKQFRGWSGDLLISSLRASSLFRVRVDGERVAFSEPIPLGGARIRDLVEHPDGTIALLTYRRLIMLRPASGMISDASLLTKADE